MAEVRKIEGKEGVSYELIASFRYDPDGEEFTKTKIWTPPKRWKPETADRWAAVKAEKFERDLRQYIAEDKRASDILEALLMPKEEQGQE